MATTFTVFSLGKLSVWDPQEGNQTLAATAVNEALGTYGSAGDPLYDARQEFSPADPASVSTSYALDNNQAEDKFKIDGEGDHIRDATMAFEASITYTDGSTATITAKVFQDTQGNTYWAPEVSDNADQAAINAKPIESLELISPNYRQGTSNQGYNLAANRQESMPLCLSKGALIDCPDGSRRIEDLAVGDLVLTRDDTVVPIRWIGRRILGKAELEANPKLLPVRISAGALGDGLPKRDLVVSRQHRMLVNSKIAKRMFGDMEVLISAIKLTELPGIFVDESVEEVEYFHLLFDSQEIICADGTPTESLFTGPEALKSVDREARDEILTLFPQLADLNYVPESARFIPAGAQQKKLVARHLKNKKLLIETSA